MSQDKETKQVIKWIPLEANPEVWNEVIHKCGVDPRWNYVDVLGILEKVKLVEASKKVTESILLGFDPELLAMIPQPVQAMIFLYPITEASEKYKEEEEAHLIKCEQSISPDVIFFKQTISNACGMMALLHSVASSDEEIVGPGLFQDIIEKAKNMSTEERVDLLENCKELAAVHAQSANEGQSRVPDISESIDLHFICFIEVDQHLYELDGRKLFPINHGKCTDLVESSAKVMRQYMERDPEVTSFGAIALCKTED